MKNFIGILILFFLCFSLKAQVPATMNLRIGDSESKGLLGAEVQVLNFSIAGGWRPERMPIPDGRVIHSFDVAFVVYGKQFYESSFYLSVARASQGIVYLNKINLLTGNDTYKVEPSIIFQVGHRFNFKDMSPELNNKFSVDTGLGWNFGKDGNMLAFEFIINYSLCKKNFISSSIKY